MAGQVRDVTADLLRQAAYDVVEAAGASAALDILKAHNAIEVALVDYAIPLVAGQQFVAQALQHKSDLTVIDVTGNAAADTLGSDRRSVLRKPYRRADLLPRVEDALPRGRSTGANVVPIRTAGNPGRDAVAPVSGRPCWADRLVL